MKNIKRILNLILIIFVILSAFAIKIYAIDTEELDISKIVITEDIYGEQNYGDNIDSLSDGRITGTEYFSDYDIFCSQQGVNVHEDINLDNIIKVKDASGTIREIDVGRLHPVDDYGTDEAKKIAKHKLDNNNNEISALNVDPGTTMQESSSYRVVFEKIKDKAYLSPKEAYVLSEMFKNVDGTDNADVYIERVELGERHDLSVLGLFGIILEDLSYWGTDEGIERGLEEHFEYFEALYKTVTGATITKRVYIIQGRFYIIDDAYTTLWHVKLTEGVYATSDTRYKRSYVQKAWWKTDESTVTSVIDGGTFWNQAEAFEDYMLDLYKYVNNVTSATWENLEYTEDTYEEVNYSIVDKDMNGNSEKFEGVVKIPKFAKEYEAKFVENDTLGSATVSFDAENGNYLIGPFAIEYLESFHNVENTLTGDIIEMKFSGIESCSIKTNKGYLELDGGDGLVPGEYAFLHNTIGADLKTIATIDSSFPLPNEKFYIVIPYTDEIKEISNIQFKFKNMLAGGQINKYEASAYRENWKIEGNQIVIDTCEFVDLQDMTEAIIAARWYEYDVLNTNVEITDDASINFETQNGSLKVVKQVKDENGNPIIVDKDTVYSFNLKLTRKEFEKDADGKIIFDGSKKPNIIELEEIEIPFTVLVPAGQSMGVSTQFNETWENITVKDAYWHVSEFSTAPSYKVEEIDSKEIELKDYSYVENNLTNNEGNFEKDTEQIVTVINKYSKDDTIKKGYGSKIKIVKQLINDKGEKIAAEGDTKFEFKVTITREGGTVERTDTIDLIVLDGTTYAESEPLTYTFGEGEVFTYKVEEINIPTGYSKVSISPEQGKLEGDITVIAKNKGDGEAFEDCEGQIEIKKELIDDKGNPIKLEEDKTFTFKLEVKGEMPETISVTVPAGSSTGRTLSKVYSWDRDEEIPDYEVEETDKAGYELKEIVNGTGKLNTGSPIKVTAINTKSGTTPKYNKGKVEITKKLTDLEGYDNKSFDMILYVTFADGSEVKEEFSLANDGKHTSKEYFWKENETPPTYRVEEIENPGDGYVLMNIEMDNNYLENCLKDDGTVDPDKISKVTVWNGKTTIKNKGELQVVKVLKDSNENIVNGVPFTIDVTVNGIKETIIINSGDSWAKEYTWDGDSSPEYEVKETPPSGYTLVGINPASGNLKANDTAVVKVENKINSGDEKYDDASLNIEKYVNISDDKVAIDEIFKFKVTIYYEDANKMFLYNGTAYDSHSINVEIKKDASGTFVSGEEKLYGEADPINIKYNKDFGAPKYIVEEISPSSLWKLDKIENAKGSLDGAITSVFYNKQEDPTRKYILTMELGGIVWNDTNYSNGKVSDVEPDGLRKIEEKGIPNVRVDIYTNKDNSIVKTVYTDGNGNWRVPKINVPYSPVNPYAKYYVIFTYDGQTYEPTKELIKTTGEQGTVTNFKTNDTPTKEDDDNANRLKYLDGSMAIENSKERNIFNNKFAKIWGENPIRDDGTTLGKATSYDLEYISRDIQYNGYSKKESKLVTLNEDGTAKYEMTASTKELELEYPFDNKIALVSADRTIEEGTPTISYIYHAAYPYLNNINLGLVERPHADIAIEKDLEEAIVVINGKIYKYKYGEIANTQFAEYPDLLYKQIQINQRNIEYKLNLYKSDYYYRASVYNREQDYDVNNDGSVDSYDNIGNMLSIYLNNIGIIDSLNSLNLDVYLTYKISVTNESDIYDVEVNQISDYVDSSLELVTEADISTGKHTKYIDNIDGTPAGAVEVANKPDWDWNMDSEFIDQTLGWRESNPVTYTRYTTDSLAGTKIVSGETVSSKLTFKVKDDAIDTVTGLDECISLGEKNNIVEIDNYSTYKDSNNNGTMEYEEVVGRVDEDSAPGNIDISKKNSINWYEDDTERAPRLKIGLYEIKRHINGIVWEDEDTKTIEYNQVIGDGELAFDTEGNPAETLIGNMTTKLVEKVTIDGIDYDFIWPTDMKIVPGESIQDLTTFDSEIVTGDTGDKLGKYSFTGIPAGNYVVRFAYGDNNTLKQAVDEEGNPLWDANGNIIYAKDDNHNIKYSGQDYKSTTYQVGSYKKDDGTDVNNDKNNDGYLDNEWHELDSEKLANVRISDARDDESRRLEVIAKSQNMFYENTSIMSTGTNSYNNITLYIDTDGSTPNYYDDALETYYMEANTAKLNMNVELENTGYFEISSRICVKEFNTNLKSGSGIDLRTIEYDVKNIDFGLETRSENDIKLDKQIEQITLKTSAGDVLIDAKYDISYDYDATGRIITPIIDLLESESIGTENLQALNRTAPDDLGFRYLNVDKDLLQGATITIKYIITALNTGEVDRCNQALINLGDLVNGYNPPDPTTDTFEKLLVELRNQEADSINGYTYGQYLGKAYYQGADYIDLDSNGEYTKDIGSGTTIDLDDAVVSSKVKQVIDYVDNDVVFSQIDNTGVDSSWANTTTAELEDNRLIDNTNSVDVDGVNSQLIIEEVASIPSDPPIRKIVDSRGIAYESTSKNNLIVSVENDNNSDTALTNYGFIKKLTPYDYTGGPDHQADINVTVSRYYSSDMDIEEIENITETLKLYNDVGRRDLGTIQGNTHPALGPTEAAFGENDSSATELITLSPPTGTVISAMLALQVMAIVLVAITILAGGIAIIKRKVLIK